MTRRSAYFILAVLGLLIFPLAGDARAQTSKSAAAAKDLVSALDAKKLDAIAGRVLRRK